MEIQSKFPNFHFKVDAASDSYGPKFWDTFAKGEYEPDTTLTLLHKFDTNTIFFDVGAATGAMSLMAASQGSKVIAYEPISIFFEALSQNLALNPGLVKLVTLRKAIISTREGEYSLTNAVGHSISSIVFDPENSKEEKVSEVLLVNEINTFFKKGKNLVLKVDIEGAEYKIFQDLDLLNLLQELNAEVILAIHPGFFRPIGNRNSKFWHLRHVLFVFRNMVDNFLFYRTLTRVALIYRSNKVKVSSPTKFAIMAAVGVFEFYLIFGKTKA